MKKNTLMHCLPILALTPGVLAAQPDTPVDQLDTVVVTATRSEQNLNDAPASISVVTAEDIRRKGASNLLEAIRGTPGITVTGHGLAGRKTFGIRGADDKHTLVLIDGQRISSTDDYIGHSDYQYGWVPMEQIERIEIIRGPMSALYGSEALGGVVNIITRKAPDEWTARFSLRGDATNGHGGNGHQASAWVSGGLGEHFDLSMTAEQSRRGSVASDKDPRLTAIESSNRRSGSARLGFTPIQGQRLQADISRTLEDRAYDTVNSRQVYYRNEYALTREHKSLSWQSDWQALRTDMSYAVSSFDVTNRRSNGVAATRPQYLRDRIWNGNAYFSLGKRHDFTLGAEHRNEYLRNDGMIGGSDEVDHQSVYLQDEIRLLDDLGLTLGGRYDHHGTFGSRFSPRAYTVWHATDRLTVKAGFGTAFRAPTLKQSSSSYVGAEGPHTFLGNSDIKPEISRSYELGLSWQGDRSSYSATVFESSIKNLISTRLVSIQGVRRTYIYDNIARSRLRGMELATSQSLTHGFSVDASVNLLHSRNRDTGEDLPYRPSVSSSTTLRWQQGQVDAGLEWQYIGRQYMSDESNALARAPGYSLFHANVRYALNRQVDLRAGITNLTDTDLEAKSDLFGYAEQGRTFWLGMDVTF